MLGLLIILDMSNDTDDWFIFDSYREMKVMHDGKILVIRPFEIEVTVPIFCPLCNFSLKTIADSISYRKNNTCDKCDLRWGKTAEEVDITTQEFADYLKDREILHNPILILR